MVTISAFLSTFTISTVFVLVIGAVVADVVTTGVVTAGVVTAGAPVDPLPSISVSIVENAQKTRSSQL